MDPKVIAPAPAQADELSDNDLEQVSGGAVNAYLVLNGQKQNNSKGTSPGFEVNSFSEATPGIIRN